jgi:integrase
MTNSGNSMSPTTEPTERSMDYPITLSVRDPTGICGDCATLFVSLKLSRSTWVATSLALGSRKMSKQTLVAGDARKLLDLLARLKSRAEQRMQRRSRLWRSRKSGSMVSGFIACSRPMVLRATSSIRLGEVLTSRKEDFDLHRGIWTKPSHQTKQNRTEHLHLSAQSLTLIASIIETSNAPSPFLFPGNKPGQPLCEI